MSYQTEEVLPVLDGVKSYDNERKKKSFRLAAFVVLGLAVTSFMAGRASSSAAVTASTVKWMDCREFYETVEKHCGCFAKECLEESWCDDPLDCAGVVVSGYTEEECTEVIAQNPKCASHAEDDDVFETQMYLN